MNRLTSRSLTLISLISLVTACGLQPDSTPSDVAGDVRSGGGPSAEAAVGLDRVYFVEPGKEQLLRAVPRNASSRENLIQILFDGPNSSEITAQFQTSIPSGTKLLKQRRLGYSAMVLDVSEELGELTGEPLIRALAQIVYTASETDVIEAVQITVNGEQRSWPTGTGETKTGDLRVFDFPSSVRSAQPPYPAQPVAG